MFNDHFIELTFFLHTTVVILKILTAEVKKNRGGGRSFVGGGRSLTLKFFGARGGSENRRQISGKFLMAPFHSK